MAGFDRFLPVVALLSSCYKPAVEFKRFYTMNLHPGSLGMMGVDQKVEVARHHGRRYLQYGELGISNKLIAYFLRAVGVGIGAPVWG